MPVGYAADGPDEITSSRSEDAVSETTDLIESYDADTTPITCDIIDGDLLAELRATAEAELGGIDAVVASQGVISRKPLLSIGDDDFSSVPISRSVTS